MPIPGALGELTANTLGEAIAFAAGFAAGRAMEPIGVQLAQEAWKLAPIRAPDAGTLAEGVAQGQVDEHRAHEWASEHGYDGERFGALVDIANTGPALGYAFAAWRRGLLSDDEFLTALKRTGLEAQWTPALRGLRDELLDAGELAKAIHRGIMRGDGLLVTEPSTAAGEVPIVPPSTIDPVEEAAGHGITRERLRVLVGNAGLPPSPGELLQLLNRGRITPDDYSRGIGESNIRNEWGDALMTLRRRLLTPHEYAELNLRGWISVAERDAGASLSGLAPADTELLFKMLGRPLVLRQVTTGLARGGAYGGNYEGVPEPFLTALRQSNVRPEWGNIAYSNRYTYPAPFVLRALTQSGEVPEREAHEILLFQGWEPSFAERVAKLWAGGPAAKPDPHVAKAATQLWTATHKAYVVSDADEATVRANLTALGAAPEAQPQVLALWQRERELTRLDLTPSQIKKAYGDALLSREVALARLERLGMTPADAATLLDE